LTRIKNVRRTTKFKRSIKAISPVIATLLMIAIAVVASLVVYAWVTGYIGGSTTKAGKAIQIPSFAVDDSNNLHVYVQNVGQGTVQLSAVYVNDVLKLSPNDVIAEGNTFDVFITGPFDANTKLNVKVTTTEGTFMTATGTPGSNTNPTVSPTPGPSATVSPTPGPSATATPTPSPSPTPSPTPIPQVTFVSTGTADASEGSSNNPTPSYPTGLQLNDLIILQVSVQSTSDTPTTPTDFTLLFGPDSNGNDRQWIYYKFSTGSESGILTVSVSGYSTAIAQMYSFRNVAVSSFTEGGSFSSGTDNTVESRTVTTTGSGRLAVSLIFVDNNVAVSDFTGENGGNWVEVVNGEFQFNGNNDGTLDLQIATMATAGTITNSGVATIGGYDNWGVRAFALIPN
jgi:flagellin-like protein